MARIKTTKSKNSKSYTIIDDYNRNGKRTTRVIDRIGNFAEVSEKAKKENLTVEQWLNNYLKKYLKDHHMSKEVEEVIIKKNANKLIPKNTINKFDIGYLFLKDIYYSLKLDKIIKEVAKDYKQEFDLNEVFQNLIYARIIYPSSKLRTLQQTQHFIETPKYSIDHLYRGLNYLNENMDFIQKELYKNSKAVVDRNTRVLYFDCTNYYFYLNEENDFQKYGHGKDGKAKPLVGMGLFMDGNGLPIAMCTYPGNKSETQTLIPLQEKIAADFDLENKNTIICTDAAMCTDDIKKFNIKDGRAFVITQSLKKLKEEYQKEVFNDEGWRKLGDMKNVYKLSDVISKYENWKDIKDGKKNVNNKEDYVDYSDYYDTIFYKIVPTETAHVVQDLIVTFQIKYRDYLRNVRNGQIERARKKISSSKSGEKMKLSTNPNDFRRLIKETVTEKDSKKKTKVKTKKSDENKNSLNEEPKNKKEDYNYSYSIDENKISEEEKYDGYYAITTNLTGEVSDILKISKNRWEIEESFRIMKSDFDSGTVYLSNKDRINAHFLTCFIALLIYRILENKLDYKFTSNQIIDKLREMQVYEEKGAGYSPAYVRDDLSDALHDTFGFRTDYEIVTYEKFKKIFNHVKK